MIQQLPELFCLLFILITFGYSGYEKTIDWKGQILWLQKHFEHRFLYKYIPTLLGILIFLDAVTFLLCCIALIELLLYQQQFFGLMASSAAAIVLLCLLYGQRVAKDFQGAATISIYFGIIVLSLWLFST